MNVNVTKIQRLSNGIIQFYNGSDIVDSFSVTSSVSIGFESNLAKTIIFSSSVKTLSFNVFNIIALYGSASNKIYSAGIDPSDTSSAYVNRLYDIYGFLISDVIQGCCPGPTFVGGVVASYPNFASFPATGQQSVIYIDESTNQAYYWDGTSYQLLTSTGVETYPNFASFPVTGMVNIIYVDLSVPESYVWDGSVYVSLDGGSVAWGSIIGTLSAQTDLQTALNAKQATLVSGTNIKTVNSTSLLGAGDVSVGTVTSVGVTAGTGISVSGSPITSSGSITVTNSAPDQTVALTAGTGIGVTGTYPNFTITNSSPSSGGTVTSVGLTMPSAFSVASSPVTTSGTLAVTGAGVVSQYVRGDGSLANFPSSTGGGSSLSYYLNGSVAQGTFGGVAMKEMDRVPILGAGTDFSIAADGYIQSFITDANVPNLLEIPAGNWNFETYFSASSSGGTPSFYVELYKWNGTTLSLIASNSATPEGITNGTSIDAYFSALAVPQTVLTVTDRLAIRIYVTHSGRTITLHTEDNHLCQVITTFSTGLTALNGLTASVQNLAVGTAGTDFGISSATSTHTFNLPTASAANRGALSSTDWTTFNNKQNALGFTAVPTTRTISTTAPLSGGGDLSADRTLSMAAATTSVNGYLTSTDWTTFNGKQNALTLTTTGTSGASTLVGATLNIPQYSGGVILAGTGSLSTERCGVSNNASGANSGALAGTANTASGNRSIISGGASNTASNCNSTIGGGFTNTASGDFSTIGGGKSNCSIGEGTTIAGGNNNCANTISGYGFGGSFVGGGSFNSALGNTGVIGGGINNTISAIYSSHTVIGGGRCNTASGDYNTISGGSFNTNSGYNTTVGGGNCNISSGILSTIGGGQLNTASSGRSTISGGCYNVSSGCASTISGGYKNFTQAVGGFIGGGTCNSVYNVTSGCLAFGAVVVGGVGNNTTGGTWNLPTCKFSVAPTICNAGIYSAVGGGFQNRATGGSSTISGGYCNTSSSNFSNIGGGYRNIASSTNSAVLGGTTNNTSTFDCAMIVGSNITANRACTTFVNDLTIVSAAACSGCGVCVSTNGLLIPYTAGGGGGGIMVLGAGALSTERCGVSNNASGANAAALGGSTNVASGSFAVVVGGEKNLAQAIGGFIGGGECNNVCSVTSGCLAFGAAVVGGVGNNTTGGTWSLATCTFTVAPTICDAGIYSFVGGGFQNIVNGCVATISGGFQNRAMGCLSTISGGCCNTICCSTLSGSGSTTTFGSFIGGGVCNIIRNSASNSYSTNKFQHFLGGGLCNIAGYTTGSAYYNSCNPSVLVGGVLNQSIASSSFIGNGCNNITSGQGSSIVNGFCNTASGISSSIVNGASNTASGACSFIAGGNQNIASSAGSAILGGTLNNTSTFARAMIVGSTITADRACTTFVNNLSIKNIPTVITGLPSGSVWSNGGILNIVP